MLNGKGFFGSRESTSDAALLSSPFCCQPPYRRMWRVSTSGTARLVRDSHRLNSTASSSAVLWPRGYTLSKSIKRATSLIGAQEHTAMRDRILAEAVALGEVQPQTTDAPYCMVY